MNKSIIIAILVLTIAAQTHSLTPCTCSQLQSKADCTESAKCTWNSTTNLCANNPNPQTTIITYPQYCDVFSQTDCPNITGCAWINEKCTFFTGCTPFNKITDQDCQTISNRCITDGTHCVEKTNCSAYVKQLPCVKNSLGSYCFWDAENNICSDANTCDKLPVLLKTDKDCRKQISTCTTTGDGCIVSRNNCSDQMIEIQCVWNIVKTQACYWTGSKCIDRKCENAPITLTTDDQCNAFTMDQTCTTKLGGGCVTRTTCQEGKIQSACVRNSQLQSCFWNGSQCLDLICSNAPNTFKTNQACFGFLSMCITNGNGCVMNTTCSSATIKQACIKNAQGTNCIWDKTCKEKTCNNAPSSYNSHALCTVYLSTCTVNNTNNGCTNRICSNAPSIIISNLDCEIYLPNSKCITKSGGGCIINTTCEAITIQQACIVDVNGTECFWDESKKGQCKNKTCSNAPSSYTDDASCFQFSNQCTVSSNGKGCVNRTCENILTSELCKTDLKNKECIYKGLCYKKECTLAPSSFATHADCNGYLRSCTLSNTGVGCTPIPLICSAITNQGACYLKKVVNATTGAVTYANCGWNGSQCIDWGCTTLATTNTTTAQCEAAYASHYCVSANPVNGTVAGCIDLPTSCSARTTQDNCEVTSTSGTPKCIWNLTLGTPACVDKSCDTASAAGTTGVVVSFTNSNCGTYLSTCIANNAATGCMAKPTSCTSLAAGNCANGSKTRGDCYWGASCVDKTCAYITLPSHGACKSALRSCTVQADGTGCMNLAATCSTYTSSNNCYVTSAGKNCVWTGTVCRSATCNDAPDDATYDIDSECLAYPAVTETCTVIYKVGGQGCVSKSATCSDYTSYNQCYRTISATSDDCIWTSSGICQAKSAFTTGACTAFNGTQADCEQYRLGCTNTGAASATTACTFDCTKKTGSGLTFSDCQTFDSTCSVNADGTGCITKAATCAGYTAAGGADCVQISSTALCVWKTTGTAACQSITAVGDCAFKTGAGLTHTTCQSYSTLCTANLAATSCQEFTVNCDGLVWPACSRAQQGLCVWDGSACIKPATVATDCAFVIGLAPGTMTDAGCASYLTGCNANADGSGCQEAKATCAAYDADTKCTNAISDGKCYWNAGAGTPVCIKITTASTDCVLVTTASITHTQCQAYNTGCTLIKTGGCQELQANCTNYSDYGHCNQTIIGAKCFWYSPANGTPVCIQIQSPSSDCVKVTTGVSTFADCQTYNSGCSINRAGTACVQLQATCGGYSSAIAGCVQTSATSLCISTQGDTSCFPASSATTCETIFLGTGNYNDTNCNKFKTGCTANLAASATACATKACTNYFGGIKNHAICNGWVSTCTVNIEGDACVTIQSNCGDTAPSGGNCQRAYEGECVVSGSVCVRKTCDTAAASASFDNDGECSAYRSTCTVARTGGCQTRTSCASYKSSLQCKISSSGGKCFWNPTALTCVDLSCANIEQSTLFDTHSECVSVDSTLKCTVRAKSGTTIAGCMARAFCNLYQIQDQCSIDYTGRICDWNTNIDPPVCSNKTCATANIQSYSNHEECNSYLNNCTVAVVINNQIITLAGCQQLTSCNLYKVKEQCYIDDKGNMCGWNGQNCDNKSCTTAPVTDEYSSDIICRTYYFGCTVSDTGKGCIPVTSCESYKHEGQCYTDTTGASCYWDTINNKCITRKCDNAPSDVVECNTYLPECTSDSIKCKTKICEDFPFTSDSECSAAKYTCTSNGINCVTRRTCDQALTQTACVTQSDGARCQWISQNEDIVAHCEIKTCSTAPNYLISELECQQYLNGCTTKSNGGCAFKSSCAAANVQTACTKDVNGKNCHWDQTINSCRNQQCKDYLGSTYKDCQTINSSCTAGNNGFCDQITTCQNTKVRQACIRGIDGPCLWIEGYQNSDATQGACFSYTSCQSLDWTTNSQCNLISDKCTTNGSNCIGITLCNETNTNGGCVNGYDGACIQSVDYLGSSNPSICKTYTSCADAFYVTHSQCYAASNKCTTNGITGCIELSECSKYTESGCYLNNIGVKYISKAIISTGICTWDNTASACRDQICSDLTGPNNDACSSQLSSCTSDGTKCIAKAACSTYAQAGCSSGIGVGTDGVCFWDSTATTPACRPMACGDVVGGTSTAVCGAGLSGCVSDGVKCIAKSVCSAYTTKISCNSGGTDGICAFTATGSGKCKTMTACADATSDQTACTVVKDRCAWTTTIDTNATASKCKTHKCATYQSTNGACGNFLNWDKTRQQICKVKNGQCQEFDPSELSTDCYIQSGYAYTWSSSKSKCEICQTPTTTNNTNNTSNTSNTNSTSNPKTQSEILFTVASLMLAFFIV